MTKWTKNFPKAEGWYWVRYTDKHKQKRTMPGCISQVGDTWLCHAGGGFFTDKNRTNWKEVRFGPAIPYPD